MNLVVLGAPGAGKGTQSRNLAKHYNLVHVSTGDILRNEMAQQTEIGISIAEKMKLGVLVPDEIITELLKKRLKQSDISNGFILDGYPRTLKQAETLESFADIHKLISVFVPDDVIIRRMTGRFICKECSEIYHLLYHPPKVENKCDLCFGDLVQRDDDKAKTVISRLLTYHKVTEPIIYFYNSRNKLIEVSGTDEINQITNNIVRLLGEDN